jgi:hypothetical protein
MVRVGDSDQCGQMKGNLHPLHGLPDTVSVTDVTGNDLNFIAKR